ncbi:heparinase II/III domain-containing protein [Fodinicola feengrottensis]|uniref:heparinase II/III domain-containing protein n=1 Tax=Fodinicola feengrottensis TaxID=435914 RepID=UPI0024419CCA|nr:heparinase II/III family protein [Fodinicola feengrottensis]
MLWYDPTVPAEPPDKLPLSAYFPDLGLVTARTSWDDNAVSLSFKASPGGGHSAWETSHWLWAERGWETLNAGHHHPDANTFVLNGHGSPLVVEDGYANEKLTSNHNVVLVDGTGYAGDGRYHVYRDLPESHLARVYDVQTEQGWVHAVGEVAAMYPPELGVVRATRQILFSPTGSLLVIDDLAAESERTWTWLLHSDQPTIALSDGRFVVRNGSGALVLSTFQQGIIRPDHTVVRANPTASTPSLTVGRTLHTLRRELGPVRSARFVSLLLPGSALEKTPDDAAHLSPDLVSWTHDGWDFQVQLDIQEMTIVDAVARSDATVRRIRPTTGRRLP